MNKSVSISWQMSAASHAKKRSVKFFNCSFFVVTAVMLCFSCIGHELKMLSYVNFDFFLILHHSNVPLNVWSSIPSIWRVVHSQFLVTHELGK